nr:ribonuclease H-like domain, reverse transcriptase, RNA-dependent DNA polymerase [Tanacetum cinerariifolium]
MDPDIDSSSLEQIQTPYDNEEHYVQYKEYLENPYNEIAVSNSNQEKKKSPQDSDIRQLIREECCIEVCRKQKQNMKDTMLELVEVCRQKEFYCMHNDVDDLIESALNSKLLSINLESQRLNKKKLEVKNIVEQQTKCGTPEEPEYSLSMRYEHLSIIPDTESDEVTDSSAKNLLPIPSEYEVTSDDESECDVPNKDESSPVFTTYSNPLFDDEEINSNEIYLHHFNVEYDFVESLSNHDTLIDSSLKFDFLEEFSGALMPTSIIDEERIRREHKEYINLIEKLFSINLFPCPLENFQSNTIVTSPIPVEDSDSQREEIDIFTGTDDLLPPSIESDDYDSEGEIHFPEELIVNDFISISKNECFTLIIRMIPVMNNNDELNEDECFDPGGEIDVFTNVEDDDYFPFIIAIRIFLPYLIYPENINAIGTKWVYRNKKDERGIIVRNKVRLVAQGYTQEEGIDYDEVFAHVARIEAIGLFLAYASFMRFIVYQMNVKSAFLYDTIEDEVYVCQPPGFEDPHFPNKVYKVEKALYGLHQAPRAWYKTLSTYLLEKGFIRRIIDKNMFIKKDKAKYVADILKKFDFSLVKTASTLIETNKVLLKDEEAKDVDVYLYISMIGSLMYLTASRLDIMFAVCACARFKVTPKVSHLHAVKRIFRYLKGQPKLGLWYPRDSPFDLEAFLDGDYAGASLDRKFTTGGCQFLGKRLISWQCKKQTAVANSTTEAEYVAATNCCR